VSKVKKFEKEYIAFLNERHSDLMSAVKDSREISPESEAKIKETVVDFLENYFLKN
jgi:F-type H+-transporting ATPase subunit alpha